MHLRSIRNHRGNSLVQVVVASAVISVVVLGLTAITQNSIKSAKSVDARISSTSVSLSLVTFLSSQRLCLESVGSTQTINPTADKPEIKFNLGSLGSIERQAGNQNLSAEFESVFLDNIVNRGASGGGTAYEAILKFALAEKRTVASIPTQIPAAQQMQPLAAQQSAQSANSTQQAGGGSSPDSVMVAQQVARSVGKLHFVLNGSNQIIISHIRKI